MTTIRRILLVLSVLLVGAGLWALTHGGQLGPYVIARPVLIGLFVVSGLILVLTLVTEGIMLLSNVQHPEPEDPPLPPPPVLYKPDPTPDPAEKNELQKTLDAVEQAEEYLARTRHRISVVIEEDDDTDDPDTPKTPPTVA